MKRSDANGAYTSDRYECMSSDWPYSGLNPCTISFPVSVAMSHPPPLSVYSRTQLVEIYNNVLLFMSSSSESEL